MAKFVDYRQMSGKYIFTGSEVAKISNQSPPALNAALRRLIKKGRIVRPLLRHDFFVIVPHEYHSMGVPPIAWYLDSLMRYLELPLYYVGLLTAAQWNGASHFAVQETQVVVPRQLRSIQVGREKIRFITKNDAAETPVEVRSTETGTVRVSTPEATAADLVRCLENSGGLNMVATVLAELHPKIKAKLLRDIFVRGGDLPTAQRLGFLLTMVQAKSKTEPLAEWVAQRRPRVLPLDPRIEGNQGELDSTWRLRINALVETST